MWNWPGQVGVRAEPEERLAVDLHLLPDRPRHALELLHGEGVVPRRHRRVGGEHAVRADLVHGVVDGHALGDVLPQPLDHHERRVPLVGVPHRRLDAEGAEHANAAHAQDPLLPEAHVGAAGVELVHQRRGRRGG